MNMKKITVLAMAAAMFMASAQAAEAPKDVKNIGAAGGISPEMLARIKSSQKMCKSSQALMNALGNNDIDKLAKNSRAANGFDTDFSDKVKSRGITNQRSSGRCWLFTGLNVLRSQMMAKNNLPELKLSQNYNFFFDQLEKANLFLRA